MPRAKSTPDPFVAYVVVIYDLDGNRLVEVNRTYHATRADARRAARRRAQARPTSTAAVWTAGGKGRDRDALSQFVATYNGAGIHAWALRALVENAAKTEETP